MDVSDTSHVCLSGGRAKGRRSPNQVGGVDFIERRVGAIQAGGGAAHMGLRGCQQGGGRTLTKKGNHSPLCFREAFVLAKQSKGQRGNNSVIDIVSLVLPSDTKL